MTYSFLLGLLCLWSSAHAQCDANLEVSSLTGPPQCTPDGMKQMTDPTAKALAECFLECAGGYSIKAAEDQSGDTATAISKTKTCTKEGVTVVCSPVALKCAKPFTQFPNSCSGIVPLVSGFQVYVAFYSYCQKDDSSLKTILDTTAIFDAETICRGGYTYDTQFPLTGAGSGKCEASLMEQTVAGPVGCSKDTVPQIPDQQARAIIECFHECAATYTLGWQVGAGWKFAMATPKLQKCSKVDVVCAPVALTCAKSFGEFPNACSGVVTMQMPFYVAFYSYGRQVDGKVTTVLDTRVVVDRDTVCSGMYSVNTGECMGLATGSQSEGVVQPPEPPKIDSLPLPKWPMPDAEKPYEPTQKPDEPTEKPDEPTEKPDEPTEKPDEPTEKPADETTKAPEPEPEKKSGGGHAIVWICIALVLALILAFAFYNRRNRLLEEERRLRAEHEVEIPSSVNRF